MGRETMRYKILDKHIAKVRKEKGIVTKAMLQEAYKLNTIYNTHNLICTCSTEIMEV